MRYLVDSNIIIYHLNGEEIATEFLVKNYQNIAISQITFIEVLSFPFSKEDEKVVKELLNSFKILDIDSRVANEAVKNRKLKKIKIADNIILATAQIYNLTLVTRNLKDFNGFDISILNPFSNS